MKTIKLDAIHISENRQRRTFVQKELNDLAESIKATGLLQPLVLRKEAAEIGPNQSVGNPGVAGFRFVLVSGERRLRAIADIYDLGGSFKHDNTPVPAGEVPYTELGELDELEREEAEYDENAKRKDLTWQENAAATLRLQKLRAAKAARDGTPAPTVAVIAEERRGSSEGIHHENTRREIIVAQHFDKPEVRDAPDLKTAFKALKRIEETERNTQLARAVGATFTAAIHTLINADAREWLVAAPAEHFDVILTDPPYGMGADEFGDSGGMAPTAGHHYKDSYDMWKQLMAVFAEQSFRVAKPDAHLYCFCDFDRFHELKGLLEFEGWEVHRTPIIWHKPNGMRLPWVDYGPQRKYEMILYAKVGRKPVNKIFPDLVSYPADENLGHAAQKPVALLRDLLSRSARPGDKVLDPFAGTCGLAEAAHELKCAATCVELAESSYGIGLKRLEKLKGTPPELVGL